MPDPALQSSQTPEIATPSPATPSPEPSSLGASPSPSSPGTPETANLGGTATPAPQAQQYVGIRDALRNYGLDPSQFPDDHAALQHLASAYRQQGDLSQLAQYGRQYMQHADQFQAWRQQQAAQQQQAQQQQQSWWKKPEFDPSWASKLTRDPATGEIKAVAGADPGLVQKYLAWTEHQRGFLDKFAQDPIEAIKPGLIDIARQVAQEMVGQHLGGFQEKQAAQSIIQQNASWIHEHDANGRAVIDPQTGRPAFSPYGRAYAGYVQQAEQMGLRDVQSQHNFALTNVQRDYLARQYVGQQQGGNAQQQGQAAKDQFLANAAANRPNVGANGVNGSTGAPANPAGINNLRSLQDLMMKNLAANGYQAGQPIDMGR